MTAPTEERVHPDPSRRWVLTARRMADYIAELAPGGIYYRDAFASFIAGLPRAVDEDDYADRLSDVTEYALDQSDYRDGGNDRDATRAFLESFGLDVPDDFDDQDDDQDDDDEPQTTRKLVTVEARITFYVDNDADTYATERDVRGYLNVTANGDRVDDFDDDSVSVDITSVEAEFDDD